MRVARFAGLVAALSLTACHSSTSPSTSTTTPVTTTPTYNLAVSGPAVLTGLRERSQMSAMVTNDDGTTLDVTKSSTWLSSDTAVATVTGSGVVTTIAPGHLHLTAVYQTTAQGFDVDIEPVTTTLTGIVQSSDGRSGTFTLVVRGATDPTLNTVSAQVSGTVGIPNESFAVMGFFESFTGAITFSGVGSAYRFDGTVADGVLNASFTAPNGDTGVMASTSTTVGR